MQRCTNARDLLNHLFHQAEDAEVKGHWAVGARVCAGRGQAVVAPGLK